MTIKRIGIFGGSFDPPHNAHFFCVRLAAEYLQLEKVLVVPAFIQPLKPIGPSAPPELRWKMVCSLVKGDQLFQPVRWELEKKGISYTIDTVLRAVHKYPPSEWELFLIVGSDAWKEWNSWREGERIIELVKVAVLRRAGFPIIIEESLKDRVIEIPNPIWEISSTFLRQRVREGLSIKWAVPPAVEKIILQEALYQPSIYDYP
ncbi:MAG: nicotinate (nicotinamide) nucleotide adenylyltransferase [bacterium]